MSESISQGIPFLQLNNDGIKLLKCNDISFQHLRHHGFVCQRTYKKPDQLVVINDQVLIGIEDKVDARDIESAIKQITDNYVPALNATKYFIARAGEVVKVFYRISETQIIEIGVTLKGREVQSFGPRIISGENSEIQENLRLLAEQVYLNKTPTNGSLEIQPPREYYNPLIVRQNTIFSLWQKIFVSTGENAHTCLSTFVELLLYKGISDASLLPNDYTINVLANTNNTNSLSTYKSSIRNHIKTVLFPTTVNQPGVINGFAFGEQETVFKSVLQDLQALGNLAQRQIDPDFKRRIIEAFLGSAHKEGTIKSGKHLTPRVIIQAIWEMANPEEEKIIIDPACGVGGFVLEGLNYPYEFNPMTYNCFGIDRDEQMIITAKANMILHLLDRFADPLVNKSALARKINETFFQARNNGTGTLAELSSSTDGTAINSVKHPADYVFSNIPFYVNGVSQIDSSLKDLGLLDFYVSCGIGIESRFLKYILAQIKNRNPGLAFVIVTDGILYRHKDNIRKVINQNADVLGIISLPVGVFQNNNWKTSILIFKTKSNIPEYSPVFLYNVENIGVSLDTYRTPIMENDIPSLKKAWAMRLSNQLTDQKCRMAARDEFLAADKWSDLFSWCRTITNENAISFPEFIATSTEIILNISRELTEADQRISDVFSLEDYVEIELGNPTYFQTATADYQTTVKYARTHPGKYPLFSSQIDKPVAFMENAEFRPILIENENSSLNKKIISWNIKGDPCKDIREHTEPFYVTENRGLISILDNNINFNYLLYYLREHLVSEGNFTRLNEAHAGKVKKIRVKFPIDSDGNLDRNKQKSIAKNYESIIDLKALMSDHVNEIKELLNNIDVFK